MVAFKISYFDIIRLLGIDEISIEELDNLFSYAKCEIEEHDLEDDGYIKVDCKTSNRPDLWGVEGLSREITGITGFHEGLPDTSAEPSGFILEVDPKVKKIRPYIACSIIRGLTFSDFLIKQLIQLQEKIDFSYGRKRRRSSIGIYNVNMLESPIRYELIPRSSSFIPLGYGEKMTLDQILKEHPKGIEYGNILPSKGDLPILHDTNNTVLSMPPIINSNDVGRVNEETNDVLVEVTGTNFEVVKIVNNVVTQALRDRGGKVYSVEIHYPANHGQAPEKLITPDSKPNEIEVNTKDIVRYLNLKLTKSEIAKFLRKRRLDAIVKKNSLIVKYPPYRADILHWADVAEETAIAYGYMNIEPTDWKVITVGRLSARSFGENYVRDILSGCSLQEILTFTLISPEKLTTLMGKKEEILSKCVQVANPVSSNYSVLRNRLLPNLLDFISRNTHNEYPQHIFEVGETVSLESTLIKTITKAAVALADTEVSFENIHSILAIFFKNLGVEFKLTPITSDEFLEGRTAQIIVNGNDIGIVGEVNPGILENWQIFMPIAAFEINLSLIPSLNLPPLFTYE